MEATQMAYLVALVVYSTLAGAEIFPRPDSRPDNDNSYWMDMGKAELHDALQKPFIHGVAKNVILFLGDGMGITASVAGRIFKGQKMGVSGEEGYLVWERFPNLGLMKTYNVDRQVADSAGTATAYLCGVKGNFYTTGLNGHVKEGDCKASLLKENQPESILKWAQDAGKETGFVTNTRVTHATPSALYAHSAEREWECDSKITKTGIPDNLLCKDIGRQLVEDDLGRNLKVIMGGGRQEMGAPLNATYKLSCPRQDGRNLVMTWQKDKEARGATNAYFTNTKELRKVDLLNTEYIMGLFAERHMAYDIERDTSPLGSPSLKEMTVAAITRLKQAQKGFFLLVEGGRIDHGLHDNKPRIALEEILAMEKAVEAALAMVDLKETLFVVTADHSHVMTMQGYPARGNNILGLTDYEYVTDGMPYTTLMFTNGQGFNYTYDQQKNKVMRRNLTGVDTTELHFTSQSAMPTEDEYETHGGEDVAAFAMGPMAHLFHRVHEQTYVAHVMAYSACLGPYSNCERPAGLQDPLNAYSTTNLRQGRGHSDAALVMASHTLLFLGASLLEATRFALRNV